METHPSRGRVIAGAATAGQGISPSDPLGLPYIPLLNRWNAHNITARENLAASVNKAYIPPKPQLFQLGKNDTMGKSHPLLIGERMRSASSALLIVLSTTEKTETQRKTGMQRKNWNTKKKLENKEKLE